MAKIIEFYIPITFPKKAMKRILQAQKGKLIQFDLRKQSIAESYTGQRDELKP